MGMSNAEKKRRQRADLAAMGLQQYTVTWPIHRLEILRDLEADERGRHERALVLGEMPERERPEALECALARRQAARDA